jgi:nucleoside diphosphate kinase
MPLIEINLQLTVSRQAFYQHTLTFYGELVEFMSRAIVAILEKDNAVEDFRTIEKQ